MKLPMPCQGVPSQKGTLVSTHCGKVRKLRGTPLCTGECLPGKEDGPTGRKEVEIPLLNV